MSTRPLWRRASVALLAPLLILGACGTDSSNSSDTTVAPSSSDVPANLRIVSLSPTATEMLYAIGAGDQVVAVDSLSTHPADVSDKVTKISAYEPSVEAISEYKPDVVLISYDPGNLESQLKALNIDVWTGSAATSIDDAYAQITALGELTGMRAGAETLVASMKSRITAAVDFVAAKTTSSKDLTYYYELDDTYFTVTSNTFIGSLMKQFSLENIADGVEPGNDYPQLTAEAIVKAGPQYIFLADTKCCGQSVETVAKRPGWSSIPAVANGGVLELDDDIASRWGPRIVDLVEAVARFLQPTFTPES